MKIFITILLSISISSAVAQKLSYDDYMRESKFNKRLLPKNGLTTKSEDQLTAEKAYVEKIMKDFKSSRAASEKLVQEGVDQLENDPKEAMYSFNNAYLVDSTNAHIYWGYGRLYSHFKQFELAEAYYKQGLSKDPKDVLLLNALVQNFHNKYQEEELEDYLEQSIGLLDKSLKSSTEEAETYFLLCKTYLILENCEIAMDYFNDYSNLGGKTSLEELTEQTNSACKY